MTAATKQATGAASAIAMTKPFTSTVCMPKEDAFRRTAFSSPVVSSAWRPATRDIASLVTMLSAWQ